MAGSQQSNTDPKTALKAPLGILGGTFDPVHNGHLCIAEDVARQLKLADMRLMPNPQPPHRQAPLLEPELRIQALTAALAGHPGLGLELSEWQAVAQGAEPAYTVDSLRRLRQLYPERPLVFVMGVDAYSQIASWKEAASLPSLCHVVVVSRPGYRLALEGLPADWLKQYAATAENDIHLCLAGTVRHVSVTAVDVSATEIRRLLAAGKPLNGLVPEAIIKFLEPTL